MLSCNSFKVTQPLSFFNNVSLALKALMNGLFTVKVNRYLWMIKRDSNLGFNPLLTEQFLPFCTRLKNIFRPKEYIKPPKITYFLNADTLQNKIVVVLLFMSCDICAMVYKVQFINKKYTKINLRAHKHNVLSSFKKIYKK